jgi:hypothetical protein
MLGEARRPVHSRLCIDISQFPHFLITAPAGSFVSDAATLTATQADASPAKGSGRLIPAVKCCLNVCSYVKIAR